MKWASLLVCALGSTLVLVTGCDTIGIGAGVALSAVEAAGDVRVVDGSPQTVAISMAAMLKGRGFEAKVVGENNDVVLECKTAAGLKFALVLRGERGEGGRDQTRVTLQWLDTSKDTSIHVQIMTEIDKQPGAKK
jgi:hypothetical protein